MRLIGPTYVVVIGIAVLLIGCDKPAATQQAAPAPPPPAAVTAPAVVSLYRPTTQPGVIQPGDWLRVEIAELAAAGVTTDSYVRVAADGTAGFPLIDPIPAAGLSASGLEVALGKAYKAARVIDQANVMVERIYLRQPGDRLSGPIAAGDLVRIDVGELTKVGSHDGLLRRVAPDGTVGARIIGRVKVAGLTDAAAARLIAGEYRKAQIISNAVVGFVTLEPAPPDADKLDLPDGPIYPVPDALKPLFAN